MLPASHDGSPSPRERWVATAGIVIMIMIAGQSWRALAQGDRIFLQAYLQAFVFWIGFPLGAIFFLCLHHITGGEWGEALRPSLTSSATTLPLMALLSLPILLGLPHLYPWVSSPAAAVNDGVVDKGHYLNVLFFIGRTLVYFAVWMTFAHKLAGKVRTGTHGLARQPAMGAAGLILLFLTVSFAAIDWMMSVDGRWFSDIYALIVMASQTLVSLALAIATINRGTDEEEHSLGRDVGNMLLANILVWTYLQFAQLIIMWSGHESRQMVWYDVRYRDGWQYMAWFLVITAFASPFFLLLFRHVKQDPRKLRGTALLVIATQCLAAYWFLTPGFTRPSPAARWVDLWLLIIMGAFWGLAYGKGLRRLQETTMTIPANAGAHDNGKGGDA